MPTITRSLYLDPRSQWDKVILNRTRRLLYGSACSDLTAAPGQMKSIDLYPKVLIDWGAPVLGNKRLHVVSVTYETKE